MFNMACPTQFILLMAFTVALEEANDEIDKQTQKNKSKLGFDVTLWIFMLFILFMIGCHCHLKQKVQKKIELKMAKNYSQTKKGVVEDTLLNLESNV